MISRVGCLLLFLTGCGAAAPPPPENAAAPSALGARPAEPSASTPAPPPEEHRCDAAEQHPSDNMNALIDDADGELARALDRSPPDAAAEWATVLRRLSKECAGTEVEHALPSTRVSLRTPSDCKPGAPLNELSFDFAPSGTGSQVRAQGQLVTQGKNLGVNAAVSPASDRRALCASGRVELGKKAAPGPARPETKPDSPAAKIARERWLVVPFQLIGGVLGLLPIGR